jgi:hypothetical protein
MQSKQKIKILTELNQLDDYRTISGIMSVIKISEGKYQVGPKGEEKVISEKELKKYQEANDHLIIFERAKKRIKG